MIEVGVVTHKESQMIEEIFEKKVALNNLLKIVAGNKDVYQKASIDYKNIEDELAKWWSDMSQTYGWKSEINSYWTIDFKSGKIYLMKEQNA